MVEGPHWVHLPLLRVPCSYGPVTPEACGFSCTEGHYVLCVVCVCVVYFHVCVVCMMYVVCVMCTCVCGVCYFVCVL